MFLSCFFDKHSFRDLNTICKNSDDNKLMIIILEKNEKSDNRLNVFSIEYISNGIYF